MEEDKDLKYSIFVSDQVKDFIKVQSERVAEEDDIDMIEFQHDFEVFMEGSTEVLAMPDGCFEWTDKETGEIHHNCWMDIFFVRGEHYMSPLCVVSKRYIDAGNEEGGEPFDYDSWWDIDIDDEYLTRDNLLSGVQKWLDKYYPELAKLPLSYPDELTEKRITDKMFGPIEEIIDKIKAGTEKLIPLEDVLKELDIEKEEE
jgi:hypothetical protein